MKLNIRLMTILLTVAGSRAYGMATPTSDVDMKGVAIPPKEYFLGFANRFDQAEGDNILAFQDLLTAEEAEAVRETKLEGVVYSLVKFMGLAADANPNILDALFCRDEEVRLCTPLGAKLRENRDLFLSAKAKHTFSGYAAAQMKRIVNHRQWLVNPPKAPPKRSDFGLQERAEITKDQLAAIESTLRDRIASWDVDLTSVDMVEADRIKDEITRTLRERVVASDDVLAARSLGLDDNLVEVLVAERSFANASRSWGQYQDWQRSRNPERAALEAKFGYDCYLDDTEFLTAAGWKRYEDVSADDKLATVYVGKTNTSHRWGTIEYQSYTERFEGSFTGNLYHFTGTHTDTMVTPNHRMLYRPVEKNTRVRHDWVLDEAASLPNCFEVLRTIVPTTKTYGTRKLFEGLSIPDAAYMTLMGWFLSDGTFSFYENGKPKSIRISQKKGGRLSWSMSRFQGSYGERIKSSIYNYERKPTEVRPYEIIERLLDIRDPLLVARLYKDCGHSEAKRIPRWVFGLSKRLMGKLFDAMMGGDGTKRNNSIESLIYYTSLPGLADDTQELAALCGWETSKWGPYNNGTSLNPDCKMWHIHVNKAATQFKEMTRSNNIERVPVENARIVCFTVPNGTLVTRRKGNISFHGNCKHAAHLLRLLAMGREILTTGQVNVWRGGIDADFLLGVRRGCLTFDEVIERATTIDAELEALYRRREYVVPTNPDRVKLDALCVELVEASLA